ncbi:putative inactive receptor kinase [Vitis vinifera]|uniref:Putative inactive receptor kinase n=1 Tax=Vitis vinifera TaxID=29760 RepID=A0A438J5L6_VITVI|nr:putative inactive receptor kinase [Vitis vinifera]
MPPISSSPAVSYSDGAENAVVLISSQTSPQRCNGETLTSTQLCNGEMLVILEGNRGRGAIMMDYISVTVVKLQSTFSISCFGELLVCGGGVARSLAIFGWKRVCCGQIWKARYVAWWMELPPRFGNADPVDDKQALLEFVSHLPHLHPINWDKDSPVCNNWTGVTCSDDKSQVISVRLPGVGFQGAIPPNTLSRLSALQILSLRSNRISGFFPSDFVNLKNLTFLYLQYNDFVGPLPSDFSVWKNLTIINLSNNRFNGSIPNSISNLTSLQALNLATNSLSGEIPDLQLSSLQQLNLSHNNLSGSMPKSLLRFPPLVFSGNNITFETSPLPPALSPSFPPYPKPRNSRKIGEMALLGIIVAACALGLVAFAFLLIVCCSKEKEDLLRASAEVLGKGTFGTTYKAILEDATTVVVKRLKEVSVGKREFEQQMEVVGNIRHENVVELRAYYHSKDEKLMVYDYYSLGSVSTILHGRKELSEVHKLSSIK